jgi:hypothetical protein
VPGATPISDIAGILDLDASVLRSLNPHLKRGITPPDEIFGVRVPVGGSIKVVSALTGASASSLHAED